MMRLRAARTLSLKIGCVRPTGQLLKHHEHLTFLDLLLEAATVPGPQYVPVPALVAVHLARDEFEVLW